MANQTRSIWRMIITNFIKSITPKKNPSVIKGKDNYGNTYYEIPAEPQRGKRYPSRWYVTKEREDWYVEIPAEWEAWLRRQRADPPTTEEISYNQAVMINVKQKAKELEEKHQTGLSITAEEATKTDLNPRSNITPMAREPFPKYADYESEPGKSSTSR